MKTNDIKTALTYAVNIATEGKLHISPKEAMAVINNLQQISALEQQIPADEEVFVEPTPTPDSAYLSKVVGEAVEETLDELTEEAKEILDD